MVRSSDPLALLPPGDGTLGHVALGDITLVTGVVLPGVTLAVQRWGRIADDRSNVVLVEHALTGDSHVVGPVDSLHPTPGWWNGLVGPGLPLDTDRYCVLSVNVLGGCRGSTGPSSLHPDGHYWGARFPAVSVRDMVESERLLADLLGIGRWAAVIGGSMGGARTLEWMVTYPDRVRAACVLAVGARASADQIGIQTAQIMAVTSDPHWQQGGYHGTGRTPVTGLGIARRIAHLSYRGEQELDERFSNRPQPGEDPRGEDLSMSGRFAVQSYLDHQAGKLVSRFDACSYVLLTDALNRHDVGLGRGGVEEALRSCPVPCVIGGVTTDRLYPLRQQRELAALLPAADPLVVIDSPAGHDGFLTESDVVGPMLQRTLELAEQGSTDRTRGHV
ncbi:homoserine O-acetyltransferase [Dietzia sp. KRD202]|uniref:homoserine O-acetyltransferase MetX n=1 Tax=Dietzia sp. KRD202 TaxID=2729732 RepID=UPI0019CFEEA5|nr:homoserine O-acetyltransferase [Dietzia sp. KRD202]